VAITELQQANVILNRASLVMVVIPARASIDALASMIALKLALEQPASESPSTPSRAIDAVSPSHVAPHLQFLPGSSQVMTEPRQQADVIIDIAGPQYSDTIRTEPLSGGLRLHILFASGTTLTKDQIETAVRSMPYDAAIVVGAADLEELGDIFIKNADFFYNTPIINIDSRAENEHFGTVNLVDITAGSCAEIVYELIMNRDAKLLTPEVATALYAGIVAGTESFQKPSTTPRSFQTAALLIEHYANREAVIQHLVKTKPLPLIKLIGRIYARLRHDEYRKMFWSRAVSADFKESDAGVNDIPSAMHELSSNIAGFNIAFLLYEDPTATIPGRFHAYVVLGKGLKPARREIQELLGATRENGALTVTVAAPSLEAAEHSILEKIHSALPR
jgi:nanoRNase/pAp phosphatase (c-di-AMP/oligoRNAs hydrolase)